jgi:hypothetical protein
MCLYEQLSVLLPRVKDVLRHVLSEAPPKGQQKWFLKIYKFTIYLMTKISKCTLIQRTNNDVDYFIDRMTS